MCQDLERDFQLECVLCYFRSRNALFGYYDSGEKNTRVGSLGARRSHALLFENAVI